MSIMLPPMLSQLLNEMGYEWPEGDESKVFDYAQKWMAFAKDVGSTVEESSATAVSVANQNSGQAVEAFSTDYSKNEGVEDVAGKLKFAGNLMGGCLYLVGAAIIALKVVFIINLASTLVQIAEATAAAVPTAGASLSWIPIAKEICQKLLQLGINHGVNTVMGGGN